MVSEYLGANGTMFRGPNCGDKWYTGRDPGRSGLCTMGEGCLVMEHMAIAFAFSVFPVFWILSPLSLHHNSRDEGVVLQRLSRVRKAASCVFPRSLYVALVLLSEGVAQGYRGTSLIRNGPHKKQRHF